MNPQPMCLALPGSDPDSVAACKRAAEQERRQAERDSCGELQIDERGIVRWQGQPEFRSRQ